MTTAAVYRFVPVGEYTRDDCQARLAVVTGISRHGPAIADATFGCIHEHVTTDVPVCEWCLREHALGALCCRICELEIRPGHCCPVIIDAKAR